MSWGDQQQPYDPDIADGGPPRQPFKTQPEQPSPWGAEGPFQPPQQLPFPPQAPGQQPQQQPNWTSPQPYGPGADPGSGYTQPSADLYTGQGLDQGFGQGIGQPEFAPYPAAPPKKNNGLLVGIAVGALVIVGGGIAAALLLSGRHGTANPGAGVPVADLTAPAAVKGLTELTGSVAQSTVSRMKQGLAAESAEYPDPVIGAYNDAAGANLTTVLVDQAMGRLSAADQAQLTSAGSATAIVAEIMTAAEVNDAKPEATAASGGALSCGTEQENGNNVTICVWYDVKTFGTLQYVDGTTPDAAAPVADAVRAAAEA